MNKLENYITVEITNQDYFYMIENQIRKEMPKFEVGVALEKAKRVIAEAGFKTDDLLDYPIEGYYYKSPALKHYFTIIRNLQHNEEIYTKVKNNDDLRFLQNLTNNGIWGIASNNRRDIDSPIQRRRDILGITLYEISEANPMSARPWTLENVSDSLGKYYKGRTNLVELAYLTGDMKCVCCSAETNSLYREVIHISGYWPGKHVEPIYVWSVSQELQNLGEKLIAEYNKLIGSNMIAPNIFNHKSLDKKPETPRVARLGYVEYSGEYYYWILKDGYLSEKYSTEEITTESVLNTWQ